MNKSYLVSWQIDIDGTTSPKQAAMTAKWYQLHGDWSSVFDVMDKDGRLTRVDLDAECSEEEWDKILNGKTPDCVSQ